MASSKVTAEELLALMGGPRPADDPKARDWRGNADLGASLVGHVLTAVTQDGDESVTFTRSDGKQFILHHVQDCCEGVHIEDVCGEWSDLVGSPILQAEENSNSEHPKVYPELGPDYKDESFTWTFYRFATIKGQVVVRWYGQSNGYYGEAVEFEEVERAEAE